MTDQQLERLEALTLTDQQREALGQTGYAAYATSTGGKTFDGRDMPVWEALPGRIQEAWIAAAWAVVVTYATEMRP